MGLFTILAFLFIFLVLISLKQINQYERGVRFTMGKYSGIMSPGWQTVWPIFQSYQRVDVRTKVAEEPDQEVITKDNVSTKITAVMYYRVTDSAKAILEVENYYWATSQLAQTTMRNVIGEVTLDDLLTQRHQLAEKIQTFVEK